MMTDHELDRWWEDHRRRQQERKDSAKREQFALCRRLARLGVAKVVVTYDGSGDSGQVEEAQAYSQADDGHFEGDIKLPEDLADQLTALADELSPDGYENNDGGFGTVTLYVAERRIRHEHSDRYVETTSSEHEYTADNLSGALIDSDHAE